MIFLMVIENMVMEDINMMEDGKILQRKLSKYRLTNNSKILHLNSEKGF